MDPVEDKVEWNLLFQTTQTITSLGGLISDLGCYPADIALYGDEDIQFDITANYISRLRNNLDKLELRIKEFQVERNVL